MCFEMGRERRSPLIIWLSCVYMIDDKFIVILTFQCFTKNFPPRKTYVLAKGY